MKIIQGICLGIDIWNGIERDMIELILNQVEIGMIRIDMIEINGEEIGVVGIISGEEIGIVHVITIDIVRAEICMIIMIGIDMMRIGMNLFMRETKINKVEEMRNKVRVIRSPKIRRNQSIININIDHLLVLDIDPLLVVVQTVTLVVTVIVIPSLKCLPTKTSIYPKVLYTGDGKLTWDNFIFLFERTATNQKWSDKEKFNYFFDCLSDRALEYAQKIKHDDKYKKLKKKCLRSLTSRLILV